MPCGLALLVLAVTALVLVPAVEAPLAVEAVVFAVAEGEALVDPLCFPVAAPAVITTGRKVMSCPLNVAVARGGMELVRRSEPVTESVHMALVLPMSWQLRDSVLQKTQLSEQIE